MKVILAFLSNALFNFVIGLLLAKYLGPEEYGLFALAISAAIMIQTIAFDWARLAAARFYSEQVRTERPAVRATLDTSLALLILGVTAIASVFLLSGLTVELSPALAILAVAVAVANGLFDYGTALMRARFRDDLYARLVIGKNALSLLLTIGGAFWFGSARAALLGVTLSMVGSLLGLRRSLLDRPGRRAPADPHLAVVLFRYGLPIVSANLFYQSIPLVDRLVLARTYGLAESGQFSFAYDVGIRIVAAIGSTLDVLLFQIAVRADEIHGSDDARRQIGRNMGMVFAVLAPACAGLWLVLPSFERLVVPAEFHGAFGRYLGLLMPGLFCYGLIFFALHPLFQINKTTGPLVAVALGSSLVNLLTLAVLPPGLNSFAVGQGLALLAATVGLLLWARRLRPFWPRVRDLLGVAISTALMAGAVWLVSRTADPGPALMAVQVVVGAGIYVTMAGALDLCGVRALVGAGRQHLARRKLSR